MTAADPLVADYLQRLDRAAAGLAPDRRAELVLEIRDHIAEARTSGAGEASDVRSVLDRLGSPEEIAASAREDDAPPDVHVVPRGQGTGQELAAVLLLTVGSFVPVVGWVAGAVLLWTSSLWRAREKVLGTLVIPLGPGGLLLLGPFVLGGFGRAETCSAPGVPVGTVPPDDAYVCTVTGAPEWLGPVLLLALAVLPVVVAVLLHRVARARAAGAPAEPASPSGSPWGPLELGSVLTLGLGGLLAPVVAPLVGFVLVCCSPRWSTREKVVAGALGLLPAVLALSALVTTRSLL